MVVSPGAIPVTNPLVSTVATLVSELFHAMTAVSSGGETVAEIPLLAGEDGCQTAAELYYQCLCEYFGLEEP